MIRNFMLVIGNGRHNLVIDSRCIELIKTLMKLIKQ